MKTSFGSAALVGLALSSAMAFYAVSLHVAAERAGIDKVRAQIAADTHDIRMLQAELRTRARLPELQRWNEQVMAMKPPTPGQFLGSPIVLASYARPDAAAAAVRFAAAHAVTVPAAAVRQVAYLDAPAGAVPMPAVQHPQKPARHAAPAKEETPSLALDATLGGQLDAAAARERGGEKVALR